MMSLPGFGRNDITFSNGTPAPFPPVFSPASFCSTGRQHMGLLGGVLGDLAYVLLAKLYLTNIWPIH